MTLKDDLHALVDNLDEADAREVLDYIHAFAAPRFASSDADVEEARRRLVESKKPDAVLVPQQAVLEWVRALGTAEEEAAEAAINALEERLAREARDRAAE